jgi:hypothetical protein
MQVRRGELTCAAGDMGLSQALEQSLLARFGAGTAASAPVPFPFPIGGTWFCPADGSLMVEAAGALVCPLCARSLTRSQVHQLVELHPHRSVWSATPGA